MGTKDTPVREGSDNTRREFLRAGTAALAFAAGTGPAAIAGSRQDAGRSADEVSGECRNQQAGMAYRRLGRTGMMISEIVCGGDPITLENYKHLERALERGPELPRHGSRLQQRRHRARLWQAAGRLAVAA